VCCRDQYLFHVFCGGVLRVIIGPGDVSRSRLKPSARPNPVISKKTVDKPVERRGGVVIIVSAVVRADTFVPSISTISRVFFAVFMT